MIVRVYEGQFGKESLLFSFKESERILPRNGDFIYYDGETYKVLYYLINVNDNEYCLFVRKSIEEDF